MLCCAFFCLALLQTFQTPIASAATSSTLNFQGRLLNIDGGLVADGSYNIEFKIYDDPTAGTNWWTETRSGGSAVTVKNGYFSVYLGEVTPFGSTVPWDQELWMTMNVNSDGEMSPRIKLTAVPYAFRAGAVTDSLGNAYTGDDLAQLAPASVQAVNAANAALRLNQTGAGGLLQLQGDGSDVFVVDKTGAATLGAGITVGNSTSTTSGTIRWSGTDLEVFNGTGWVSLTSGGAGGGGTAVGTTAVKTTNQTKTNDATLANDSELKFPVGANETWAFRFVIQANAAAQPDIQFAVSAPSGATCYVGFTDAEGAVADANLGCGVSMTTTTSGTNETYEVAGVVVNGSTAGDVSLQWAQNSSNASATTVYAGSYVFASAEGVGGGGGGGNAFEQGGNDFSGTAILGTSAGTNDGLNIITNGSTALSITNTGDASFTNGLTISSGGLSLTGDITGTTGLTIASGGGGDLTLDSASDVLKLVDATIQRSASGTTTIDLFDSGGGTSLQITNSDAGQVAGLVVEGGISASTVSGNGSGLTALNASNISSGTLADSLLSSNIVKLDQSQTFTGTPTFNGGLIIGNSTSTTAGAVRWNGSDFEGYDGVQWLSLTSGGGGGGGGSTVPAQTTVTKPNNEVVNNSTILQDDNHLTFEVGANETWSFRFVIQANTPIAAGIKFAVTAPSGASCQVSFIDQQTAASESGVGCAIASTSMTGTGNSEVYEITGTIVNGANAGNVTLQWAQTTAVGSNTTVLAGSYVLATIDGGGMMFLQGGNDFGGTAVLGTTSGSGDGLTFIIDGSNALAFDVSGNATFSGDVGVAGFTATGDTSLDGLLTLGTATTLDANADALFATSSTMAKGLVIQGSPSQAANLFEIQDSTGSVLAGFTNNGGLVLGLTTLSSSATGSQTIQLPDASGTVCLSGGNCGFLTVGSATFTTDSTTNNSIAINKTGATGNLIALQKNGGAVFTVGNTGALQIQNSSSTAIDIRNSAGTSYFSVNTSSGAVQIGSTTSDALGVLFVLDTRNTAGDPTGQNGGMYYNSSTGKFRCYENNEWKDCIGTRQIRSYVDNTSDAVVDANTTDYWDVAAENNNTHPNITPSSTAKSVYGNISVQISSATAQDRSVVTRVERGIGSVPTCGSGTVVGFYASTFTTNSGEIVTATVTFLDAPATTSQVFYTVCSDANTSAAGGMTVDKIRVTLEEANNSN